MLMLMSDVNSSFFVCWLLLAVEDRGSTRVMMICDEEERRVIYFFQNLDTPIPLSSFVKPVPGTGTSYY